MAYTWYFGVIAEHCDVCARDLLTTPGLIPAA